MTGQMLPIMATLTPARRVAIRHSLSRCNNLRIRDYLRESKTSELSAQDAFATRD